MATVGYRAGVMAAAREGDGGFDTLPDVTTRGQLRHEIGGNGVAPKAKRAPVHPLAVAAFAVAVVAGVLALYGSFMAEKHIAGSPLNTARNNPGLEDTRMSKITRYSVEIVAFVLPMILGIGAALLGGEAMKAIEKGSGAHTGSLSAVFAILIGGLAAVVAGCMTAAVFIWPYVPTLYTT